jgi:hypothetical protein
MKKIFLAAMVATFMVGCAHVDVTKTGKGFYNPTNPNDLEVLKTLPKKHYEEVGMVTAVKFDSDETAKMHNAIRAKAAPLGANAVVLTEEGFLDNGRMWAKGVALHYVDVKN